MSEYDVVIQLIAEVDDEAEDIQELARALRLELLRLDVEDVDLVTADSLPDGAKGLAELAGLLKVRAIPGGLAAIVKGLRSWIVRNHRSVTIAVDGNTLTLTEASDADQERLVALFIARHWPDAALPPTS
jgi:hypothetical protein